MRLSLIGAPLVAVCLVGFTAACSGHNPAGGRPAGHVSNPADGTLTGHIYGGGGPAGVGSPAPPHPWPGTVTVTGPGIHRDVPVGANGTYSVTVPAGRYTVTGHSPRYDDGTGLCRAARTVTVTNGHTTTADVMCQML